jgi:ribonuclease III
MQKGTSIYTFNPKELKSVKNITDLVNLVEAYPQFKTWLDKVGLKKYFQLQPELLLNALIHTSFSHENQQMGLSSNERLEFIGDAFLDAEISQLLWEKFPQLKEGELSKFRSSLVNEEVLSSWGRILEVDSFLLLGKGESERREVEAAIVADAFEALIGAIGLMDRSALYGHMLLWINLFDQTSKMDFFDLKRLELFDPKTKLQEYTLDLYKEVPLYKSEEAEGNEGFECSLFIKDQLVASALGKNKKKAEMAAAKKVLMEEKYKSL